MSAIEQPEATGEVTLMGDERTRIEEWRFAQLVRGGYAEQDAAGLASHLEIDLHAALELAQRGCPSALATRILL